MKSSPKKLFRAAGLIRHCLEQHRQEQIAIMLPDRQWADCARSMRRIVRATERGWHRAAARLRADLAFQVDYCRICLQSFSTDLAQLGHAPKLASEGNVYRELAALEAEFVEVEYDFDAAELCVITPSVTLEGIEFGPFQIRLDWNRLGESQPYRVVALEPNPATSNYAVTHPHVSDEALCEGDGRRVIHAALVEGRLADFFLLVWRLLETYAPGQAYVELREWHGTPCHDCGTITDEDDRYVCADCDLTFCCDCTSWCSRCDQSFCLGCIGNCDACGNSVCAGCRETCEACDATLCADCVTDGRCPTCHDEQQEHESDETEPLPTGDDSVTTAAPTPLETDPSATNIGSCHV